MSGPETDKRAAEPAGESATPAETPGPPTAAWVSLVLAVAVSMPVLGLALLSERTPAREQAAPGAVVRQTVVQQLGPYRFELPPGYVFRSYRAGPDEPGGAFAFMALLPELEPRTKANEKAFQVLGWGDISDVLVNWRGSGNSGARLRAILERWINRSQWFPPVREGGFTRYRIEGGAHFELYLSDTDPDMFFTCTGSHNSGCSRTEELAPELTAEITYPHKYRFQTPEISARIRRLLLDNMRVTGAL